MRQIRSIIVVLLVAFWPLLTSHSLLEQLGVIHQTSHHDEDHNDGDHHSDHADDHDFADGKYLTKSGASDAPDLVPVSILQALWATICFQELLSAPDSVASGPSPPGLAPLEIVRSWNFLRRTALDARAPSFS